MPDANDPAVENMMDGLVYWQLVTDTVIVVTGPTQSELFPWLQQQFQNHEPQIGMTIIPGITTDYGNYLHECKLDKPNDAAWDNLENSVVAFMGATGDNRVFFDLESTMFEYWRGEQGNYGDANCPYPDPDPNNLDYVQFLADFEQAVADHLLSIQTLIPWWYPGIVPENPPGYTVHDHQFTIDLCKVVQGLFTPTQRRHCAFVDTSYGGGPDDWQNSYYQDMREHYANDVQAEKTAPIVYFRHPELQGYDWMWCCMHANSVLAILGEASITEATFFAHTGMQDYLGWPAMSAAIVKTMLHKGDMNCDAALDFNDIAPFVLALSDPDAYHQAYPDCDIMRADVNLDGVISFDDSGAFTQWLTATPCHEF